MELFENLEKKRSKTHKIAKILGITDGKGSLSIQQYKNVICINLPFLFPSVYEQRDAAEYLEKILCHTSPEASKVKTGAIINSEPLSNEWNYKILSDSHKVTLILKLILSYY